MGKSYEFDPCSIDGSGEHEVTLANWKPRTKVAAVPKSEWRQKHINGNYNQQPGLDELKKINTYLKRKLPDNQIMESFGISSETLVAIKRNCYGPIEGISLDNQSKIYKEFSLVDKKIDTILSALKFIADNLINPEEIEKTLSFKAILGINKKKKEKLAIVEEE